MKRYGWIKWALLGIVFLVLCLYSARADEIGFRWDAVTHPMLQGYRLHWGLESGVYPNTQDVAAPQTSTVASVPGGCTTIYAVAQTIGTHPGDGSEWPSEYSSEIFAIARPEITSVMLDGTGLTTIIGDNFTTNAAVYLDGATTPTQGVTWRTCQLLEMPVPATPFSKIRVVTAQQHGTTSVEYVLPLPIPQGLRVD
jgi:hypothetical protein